MINTHYHLPQTELTPIEYYNRRMAGVADYRTAMAAKGADYNGHAVQVWYNSYKRNWTAYYRWGGDIVLHRGDLAGCLRAARLEYERGGKGGSVHVAMDEAAPESMEQQAAQCEAEGYTAGVLGLWDKTPWWTERHEALREAISIDAIRGGDQNARAVLNGR